MDFTLEQRILDSKDWATVLFVLSFVLIAVTKTFFEVRFNEFLKLFVNLPYIVFLNQSIGLL